MAGNHGHDDHKDWVVTEKVVISDLLNTCPQAEEIIRKHLGPRALCIPGAKTETIEFLSAMHDYHCHYILEEINQVCKTAPSKFGHF